MVPFQLNTLQKVIILTFIICKYSGIIEINEKQRWINYCHTDFSFCPYCFLPATCKNQIEVNQFSCYRHHYMDDDRCCTTFLNNIELTDSFDTTINLMFGSRNVQFGTLKQWLTKQQHLPMSSVSVVLKYVSNSEKLHDFKLKLCSYVNNEVKASTTVNNGTTNRKNCNDIWKNVIVDNVDLFENGLKYIFETNNRVDGIKHCPNGITKNFIQTFNKFDKNALFWIQLYINPEMVLLKTLNDADVNSTSTRFSHIVPKLFDSCGFILIESYAGVTLYEFYKNSFYERIQLAKQLLQAAVQFSYGINGLRFYLTDGTPDNIVVNKETLQPVFIDLDDLIIVDSKAYACAESNDTMVEEPITWRQIHRHEKIECNGCFAYVPDELCAHHLSDINLFAICQLLLEDLNGNRNNGLLHTISDYVIENYPDFLPMLEQCVYCSDKNLCENRFPVVNRIVQQIDQILVNKEYIKELTKSKTIKQITTLNR